MTPEQRAALEAIAFHLTDTGNAERLVAMHGADIRHVPALGWYVWDGRRWARDRTGELQRLAKQTAGAIYHDAGNCENDDERKRIAAWAKASESEKLLRAMVSLAASELPAIALPEQLDASPWLLNVQNGTIDLQTGELRPHNRDDLITKIATCEYDPDAQSDQWDRFLDTITAGDAQIIAFLARAVGYTLTGSTREEVLFFAHGPGATGKSTFLEAIKATLGPYTDTADFETFLRKRGDGGIRNDVARLAGTRMVISLEVDEGRRLAEGLITSLTGGDTVTARFLHREFFEFTPAFKLWLAANHRPKVNADNDAIWRRIIQVPFGNVIPEAERDLNLKTRFRTDPAAKSAVLAWAIAGCLDWQAQGLAVPDAVRSYTAEYRAENDPLAEWLADDCELNPEHWTRARELRDAYEHWCTAAGTEPIEAKRAWGPALKRHNCTPDKKRGERGWHGIRVTAGRLDVS